MCSRGRTQGEYCRIFEPMKNPARADSPTQIIEISKNHEVIFRLSRPIQDLVDIISRTSFGIALPEEYDAATGEWKDEAHSSSSTGAYRIAFRNSSEVRLQMVQGISGILSSKSPIKEIRVLWGGLAKKLESDIAFAHSNSIDMETTHDFVGGPLSGISYVRCHSWKLTGSICGNPAIAARLRDEFYRSMTSRGYPIEPDFFFDPEGRSTLSKRIQGSSIHEQLQLPGSMTILAANSKLSPYFSAYTDAMEATSKALKIVFTKKGLKAAEVVDENNPSLSSYLVDFSVRGTEIDYGNISNELFSLFLDSTGLQLPDRGGKISKIIQGAKSNRLQLINSIIWDEAAVWPISHFSQGLYFRRGIFDFLAFNPMLPPGEFQWIGWN